MTTYTITVLGAGVVGTNLARAFTDLGHTVRIGARDVASEKVRAALSTVPGSVAMPIGDTVDGADIVVLAVPYQAITDTVTAAIHLSNAIVVDATNTVGVELEDGTRHAVDLIHAVRPAQPSSRRSTRSAPRRTCTRQSAIEGSSSRLPARTGHDHGEGSGDRHGFGRNGRGGVDSVGSSNRTPSCGSTWRPRRPRPPRSGSLRTERSEPT